MDQHHNGPTQAHRGSRIGHHAGTAEEDDQIRTAAKLVSRAVSDQQHCVRRKNALTQDGRRSAIRRTFVVVSDRRSASNPSVVAREAPSANSRGLAPTTKIYSCLPSAIRGQRNIVSREVLTKCGESTNYSRSYAGVQHRTLEDIPRITADDTATRLGQAAICVF